MKNKPASFILIAAIFSIACGTGPANNDITTIDASGSTGTALPASADTGVPAATVADIPATLDSGNMVSNLNPQPVPATNQAAKSTTNNAGLNPEHGKPNHRCDIAVGTPLSTPIQKMQQAPSPAANASTPATGASKSSKLNPAHGKPGHDCAVPVGSPLKG